MSTKSLGIADDGWSSLPAAGTALVFGAAGGIGSAIVRRLQTDRCFTKVITFSRRSTPAIDLLYETSLQDAAAALASVEGDIRLVVDATGFLHDETQYPEKTWRDLDPTKMARAFALNAIGPALIMKHVLPLLPRVGKSVFATLSARVGSIGDNRSGGWYSYRASKAALNHLVRTAAIELKRVRPEAICVALHPVVQSTRDYLRLFAKLIWTSNPQMLQHSDCSASSRAWGPAIPVDFLIIAGMPFHGDPDKR